MFSIQYTAPHHYKEWSKIKSCMLSSQVTSLCLSWLHSVWIQLKSSMLSSQYTALRHSKVRFYLTRTCHVTSCYFFYLSWLWWHTFCNYLTSSNITHYKSVSAMWVDFITKSLQTCERCHAGRRTKFAPVMSLDSSEFSAEFSDLKTFSSNVKVNPVISWNGQNSFHRIFPSNFQDFTTPQTAFL